MKKIGGLMVLIIAFSFLQIIGLPTFDADADSSISDLTIVSPQNKTYNSKFLTLNATTNFVMARIELMSYSIDGLGSSRISKYSNSEDSTIIHGTLIGIVALPELAEGPHVITVYLEGTLYFPDECHYSEQAAVYFSIDSTPPIMSSLSVENKTYSLESLPLNFVVDELTSWIGYCLDGQANVTTTENFTLTQLSPGSHTLTIYGNDTVGNMGASEIIYFTIAEPFPTSLVTASIIIIAVVVIGLGLLLYGIKRK